MINNWTPEHALDLEKSLKLFTVPEFAIAGNHDDWKSAEFKKIVGEEYRYSEMPDCILIMTNSNRWLTGGEGADVQIAWLEKTLEEVTKKNKPIIIAAHHPLYLKTFDEKNGNNTPLLYRTKILDLLEKYHVTAYLTGHTHSSIVNDYKGTLLVTCVSTTKNFSVDPTGFLYWKIDDKGKCVSREQLPIN